MTTTCNHECVLIRDAELHDAEPIAALNAAAWKAAFGGVVEPSYLHSHDGNPSQRRQNLESPLAGAFQLVCVDHNTVIGWLFGCPCDSDNTNTFEIRACYVHPSHWRRQVGTQLITEALHRIRAEAKWRRVVVWTARDTSQSNGFYESVGFRRDGQETIFQYGWDVVVIRLTLDL